MNCKIEIVPRLLHFKQPAGTSRGVYTTRKVWYVHFTSPEFPGRVGVGECAPLPKLSCDDLPDYGKRLADVCRWVEEQGGKLDGEALRDYPSILFGLETAIRHFFEGTWALWNTAFSRGEAGIPINGLIWMGDFDKMLTMLTPGVGKISCVAKGARRPKSALLAGTQMFCFGEYLLYKGTSTYHISSVEPIEVFYNIRTDLDKLRYSVHINKIIQDVTHENQNCFYILQLLLNTLYIISETDKDLDLILSIFKLRLLSLTGFVPNIKDCVNCKEKENIKTFSLKDNGFKCEACSRQDTSAINISKSTQNAIKYTISVILNPLN